MHKLMITGDVVKKKKNTIENPIELTSFGKEVELTIRELEWIKQTAELAVTYNSFSEIQNKKSGNFNCDRIFIAR